MNWFSYFFTNQGADEMKNSCVEYIKTIPSSKAEELFLKANGLKLLKENGEPCIKLKNLYPLICGCNGSLHKGEETIKTFGSCKVLERITFWYDLMQEYGECEVSEILPIDFLKVEVKIS